MILVDNDDKYKLEVLNLVIPDDKVILHTWNKIISV